MKLMYYSTWPVNRHATSCSEKTSNFVVVSSYRLNSCQRCVLTSVSFASIPSPSSSTRWTHFTCSETPRSDGGRRATYRSAAAGPPLTGRYRGGLIDVRASRSRPVAVGFSIL